MDRIPQGRHWPDRAANGPYACDHVDSSVIIQQPGSVLPSSRPPGVDHAPSPPATLAPPFVAYATADRIDRVPIPGARLGVGRARPPRHLTDRENRLNPKAKAAIAALLDEGESLADASTWADEHRRELPKTLPWHYVDVPLDEPKYHSRFSGDVPEKGSVVDKINEFRLTLKDMARSADDRRLAFRFLIHCVEDMHMPMHVGDGSEQEAATDTQVHLPRTRAPTCTACGIPA